MDITLCVRCLCWCCLFFAWISLSPGVRLYPCGNAGYQEVEENTPITFTCDQYNSSVLWQYRSPASSVLTPITTCSASGCGSSGFWGVNYLGTGRSSLTSNRTRRTPVQARGRYICEDQSCGLHVVVPAVVSQITRAFNRQDGEYSMTMSANITRVYSSRGLYSCVWQLGRLSNHTTTLDLDPPASDITNLADRTGSCDVTVTLPATPETYPCNVTVTPGSSQTLCDSIIVAYPSRPIISCTGDVIAENTTSPMCTCNTDNIGKPGGRLRWYTGTNSNVNTEVISGKYDVSTLKLTRSVTRGDHDVTKFRCVNSWMKTITAVSDYTARVAWGPDTVSIQGNTTLYTDTTGSQNMILTCQASGVNPTSALTYQWNVPCDVTQPQVTCTFKPRPPGPGNDGDVNRTVTCTVTNVKNNNRQRSNSVTLDLKYPPWSAPEISGYVNSQVLYQGDNLTLTCTVTGGNPMVTSVTLTCPGRYEQNPASGQSGSLVISSLSASDHSLTCVCRGQWVREDYYTLTDSVTLTVYWGPDTVSIQGNTTLYTDTMGSQNMTLTCRASGVNPTSALTYQWNVPCDVTQPQVTCTFKPRPPGPGNDGDVNRTVTCTVTNVKNNNRQPSNSVTLDLKYPPWSAPEISGYVNSQVLYQGDNLTLTCTVTGGSPMVTSVTLTCPGRYEQDATSGQSGSLVISSLSASDHSLTCVCRGQWVREDYYTLTDSVTLTVYSPVASVELTLNTQSSLLEVNESQSTNVSLKCAADFGRPSPNLVLSDDQGREVDRLTNVRGNMAVQRSVLTHTLGRLRCENSTVYTCTAENGVGTPIHSKAVLRVLCEEMRVVEGSFSSVEEGVPALDASAGDRELHLEVVTRDTPRSVTFLYLGPDSTGAGYLPEPGLFRAKCSQVSVVYKSRCTIKASDVTQHWIGYYKITIATGTQDVSFTFRLHMNQTLATKPSTNPIRQWFEKFGVYLGAGLAGVLLVAVTVLLCVRRRQCCRLSRAAERLSNESANGAAARMESPLGTASSACATRPVACVSGSYDELESCAAEQWHKYSVMAGQARVSRATDSRVYEELQLDAIGQKSEISVLDVSRKPRATETNDDYEVPFRRFDFASAARK